MNELKKCDCYGAYTVREEFDICVFCGWEQDRYQRKSPDETGANKVTLRQARENFKRFGKAERPPQLSEKSI